jgi:hypothetical protein
LPPIAKTFVTTTPGARVSPPAHRGLASPSADLFYRQIERYPLPFLFSMQGLSINR